MRYESMTRRRRTLFPGVPAHIVQRGNNRLPCFFALGDRHYYLGKLEEMAALFGCAVHAYVLMDNHVHLLATPSTDHGISLLMKHVGQAYVQHVNKVHRRTGALWEGRFYSSVIDSGAYLFACHRYIELNPVRAGIVRHPGDYPWSSYGTNAEGHPSTLLTAHKDYLALSEHEEERCAMYRRLFDLSLDEDSNSEIRKLTRSGLAFGSEPFRQRLADLCGLPMSPQRQRGLTPKPPLGV